MDTRFRRAGKTRDPVKLSAPGTSPAGTGSSWAAAGMLPAVRALAGRRWMATAQRRASARAAEAAGVELPRRIQRLIDSAPVSVDERIQKMLALEKWMKSTGVQLTLPRKVLWWIPPLQEELEIEIEEAGGPAQHPAFAGWEGRIPLFSGTAALAYRTLRAKIGSDGEPCSEKHAAAVFARCGAS